ncbi:hypothetical protein N658DRAFT_495375 [Parathielavia hyrcaniae]|uniref:Uncharacterized protein n=1 Tax=Parathielavia hyrcaniae TaxID=113614 RepID=A0AAN6Q316_9PEZI|nr:hypothetical protein N658DRAFT_495375 [Parathielavia hyrcaniae]
MWSGFNSDEPWSPRNLRASTYAHSQASSFGSGIDPRWAPAVTRSDLLSESGGSEDDDVRSKYGAASTVSSHYTMQSARPPSMFSSRDDAASSVGQSSAPSLGRPPVPFMGLPVLDNPDIAHWAPNQILWCEFAWLKNCPETFSLDDEIGWIQHHKRHLRETYPQQLMCWFCDHQPFVTKHPNGSLAKFEERMEHVRDHIFSDHRLTIQAMRRDLHMVRHLYDHGLLSTERYHAAMAYDETPAAFRFPASHSSSFSSPRQTSSQPARQYHDLVREERRRNRQSRGHDLRR